MTISEHDPVGKRPLGEALDVTGQVALLNSILEGSTEYSIVGADMAGTILVWNEGARRTYGYEAREVIGRKTTFVRRRRSSWRKPPPPG